MGSINVLGHKRLSRTRAGEVVLQLKTPYRDGTTHLVMTPLEFLQRIAALVPRPRLWPHRISVELEGRHCVSNRKLERLDPWPGPSVCC